MAGVRIVTDSSCDLSAEEAAELGIEIVPLTIRFGDQEFTDREDLSVEDFYRRMAGSDALPETAAPAPGRLRAGVPQARRRRGRRASCASTSPASCRPPSSPPATRPVARGRGRRPGDRQPHPHRRPGHQSCSRRPRPAGAAASVDEVVALVEDLVARTRVYARPRHARQPQEGRPHRWRQGLLGSMLSVKPLINVTGGHVEEAGRARTRKKALAWPPRQARRRAGVEHLSVCTARPPTSTTSWT